MEDEKDLGLRIWKDGFGIADFTKLQAPSSPKFPSARGMAPQYSQIDYIYRQFDYILETGCVAAFASAPALRSAGAPHPILPGCAVRATPLDDLMRSSRGDFSKHQAPNIYPPTL
jgi:hypothetical protein